MTYRYATWLLPVLRDAGLTVATVSGWESRGRPPSKGAFAPYAVGLHHTATKTPGDHPTLGLVTRGRPDLPGPLCQVLLARDGTAWLVAAGRANHAGLSNGAGNLAAGDGNAQLIGVEVETSGHEPLTPAQTAAAPRLTAAILRKLKRDETYTFLHATWSTTGKWDLAANGQTVDLAAMRRLVKAELVRLAPRPADRTRTDLPIVDLSKAVAAFRADPARPQGKGSYEPGIKLVEAELDALELLPRRYAGDGYAGTLTRDAYAAWQRRLGYRRRDADGIPGTTSLVKLGARRARFRVTA